RHHLDRLRRDHRGLARGRGDHSSGRRGVRRGPGVVGRVRALAVGRAGAGRSGARLTDISNAVETSVRSSGRYGIVTGYGGHGIGTHMHMAPHILNHGRAGKGPRLLPGMALAIEPMITLGARGTQELDDGWTVSTQDGSWAAHWEHTVAILDDGPWVLTAEDGGRAGLGALGIELTARAT